MAVTDVRQPVGVLLVNLGTPDSPRTRHVRRYLREFLSDPRVIDLPAPLRWLLLHLVILPFRPRRSAAQYASIWRAEGSPLLVHGRALRESVAKALGPGFVVDLAMRYGRPPIGAALARLGAADVRKIVVLPLFPQYASSAGGSAVTKVFEEAGALWNVPPLQTLADFYDDPGFVAAWAAVAQPSLDAFRPDFVLMSYHGLPERHVRKGDPGGRHCFASATCCDVLGPENRWCYRAQCVATTRLLAGALGLAPDRHAFSFQSRLGRDPWIEPHTDRLLPALAARGVRRLAVLCPAFVADCLETLEEIGIRAREQWRGLGGEDLLLVPSLNAHPRWVEAVAALVRGVA